MNHSEPHVLAPRPNKKATLQICDLLDHATVPAHLAAVQALVGSRPEEESKGESAGLPTVAQFKLSRELAGEPFSAQGAE